MLHMKNGGRGKRTYYLMHSNRSITMNTRRCGNNFCLRLSLRTQFKWNENPVGIVNRRDYFMLQFNPFWFTNGLSSHRLAFAFGKQSSIEKHSFSSSRRDNPLMISIPCAACSESEMYKSRLFAFSISHRRFQRIPIKFVERKKSFHRYLETCCNWNWD